MRTRTTADSGHSVAVCVRCTSTAAPTASRARSKAKKNASPCVSISTPFAVANVSRTIRRCCPSTSPYRSPRFFKELGRALDVREDERDRPARKRRHRNIVELGSLGGTDLEQLCKTWAEVTTDRSLLPEIKRLADSIPQTGDTLRATLYFTKAEP